MIRCVIEVEDIDELITQLGIIRSMVGNGYMAGYGWDVREVYEDVHTKD